MSASILFDAPGPKTVARHALPDVAATAAWLRRMAADRGTVR